MSEAISDDCGQLKVLKCPESDHTLVIVTIK